MLWQLMGYVQEEKRGTENYLCMYYRGVVEDGGEGKIRCDGGSRNCLPASEGIGLQELREMVQEIVGAGVQVDRLWYSLKYDRNMIMAVEGDTDVRMIFKGNDEHGYVYVRNKNSLVWRVSKAVSATTGETGATDDGTQGGTSGRQGDGGAEEEIQASGSHRLRKRYVNCGSV